MSRDTSSRVIITEKYDIYVFNVLSDSALSYLLPPASELHFLGWSGIHYISFRRKKFFSWLTYKVLLSTGKEAGKVIAWSCYSQPYAPFSCLFLRKSGWILTAVFLWSFTSYLGCILTAVIAHVCYASCWLYVSWLLSPSFHEPLNLTHYWHPKIFAQLFN